ncbi:LacI family DNA-binding transcriptional regulator [bacterium AH-315-I18]|nr:LacI family DNA-binding transcriptional regulator [bacterium AH-315-I18]
MTVTTQSIAKNLGLAKSTISLALRNHPSVSQKTRTRVQETARLLNYQPNAIAQAMTTGRTRVLGFVSCNFDLEHTARIFNGVLMQADAEGYLVKVFRVDWEMDVQMVVQQCRQHCLSGLVCGQVSVQKKEQLCQAMHELKIPLAQITGPQGMPHLVHVHSDDVSGMFQAVEYLSRLKHQCLGYIDGNLDSSLNSNRRQGLLDAVKALKLDLPSHRIVEGRFDPTTIERQTKMLLTGKDPITAILCINDQAAMVVIRTARAMGLQVPEDLSVIGFSDMSMAEYCDPPLTTIAQPYQAMGQRATECLLIQIRHNIETKIASASIACDELMPTKLIVRDSTGPAKLI